MTVLSRGDLNRTLLHRQHLLERTDATPVELVHHLVGLQAQETLPPYLSLLARLPTLDPGAVTRGLEDRSLVRMLTLRGTVHLLAAEDALTLRPWVQRRLDAQEGHVQNVGSAREIAPDAFATALADALADGPLPVARLGERLAETFPDHTPARLGQLARIRGPLVQLPPRGCWRRPGGVVYEYADRWVGGRMPAQGEVDVEALVRRYLAAFGPATAADMTAWSGVTRLGPVLKAMPDLVEHTGPDRRPLLDLADAELAAEDHPAPVRLLGRYDNLWLSHAGRDRVTEPGLRRRWMGANGGTANTLFADGMLAGLWRVDDGRVADLETFRTLTRRERAELDEEVDRVEALLAIPPTDAQA